jgi:hypothetical protein
LFEAAVADAGAGVMGALWPGHRLQRLMQPVLVGFDGEHVIGAGADQIAGVCAGGVQRIGGDDPPSQIQAVQQRRNPGDLTRALVHLLLRQHPALPMGERGQQMHPGTAGAGEGAAQRLAVKGDGRSQPGRRSHMLPDPGTDRRIEGITVDGGQHPPHGGLIRSKVTAAAPSPTDPQQRQDPLRRISGPFGDRHQRPGPRRHRHGRDPHDGLQPVAYPARPPRIRHTSQIMTQVSDLAQTTDRTSGLNQTSQAANSTQNRR